MDGGGGVLATGDHADIGQPLCGRILRVRSMRTWFVANPPDNEPLAPDPLAPSRLDSTQPGVGEDRLSSDYRFDDQSDDRPAPIALTPAGARHALLALPGGRRLGVLPDHMHEGEVIDPFALATPLSPVLSYGGAAPARFVEYPARGTHRPRPRVLALGTVLGGHATTSTEPSHIGAPLPTAPGERSYGAIGAYDGHAAGVGRVMVTSTFHHFVDVNLIGDPWAVHRDGTPDPARRQGFLATPTGRAVLADQHTFWANAVRWLARPS
jgi:hypothetical protein